MNTVTLEFQDPQVARQFARWLEEQKVLNQFATLPENPAEDYRDTEVIGRIESITPAWYEESIDPSTDTQEIKITFDVELSPVT